MNKYIIFGFLLCTTIFRSHGQESIYSISIGIGNMKGDANTKSFSHEDSTYSLESNYVPVSLSWFVGSREYGGFFLEVETQLLQLSTNTSSSWGGSDIQFNNRRISVGYQFYGRFFQAVQYRIGPVGSFTWSNGVATDSTREEE